jgi:hypothetical protein
MDWVRGRVITGHGKRANAGMDEGEGCSSCVCNCCKIDTPAAPPQRPLVCYVLHSGPATQVLPFCYVHTFPLCYSGPALLLCTYIPPLLLRSCPSAMYIHSPSATQVLPFCYVHTFPLCYSPTAPSRFTPTVFLLGHLLVHPGWEMSSTGGSFIRHAYLIS